MLASSVAATDQSGLDLDAWRIGRLDGVEEVPSGWMIRRLKEVARLESGHTPDRNELRYWGGDIGWLSLHDVGNLTSGVIESTTFSVTQAGIDNSSARVLPEGTVCLSRTATVGECVLLGKAMATSQDFANYVCGPLVDNRYLLQLFRFMKPVWARLSSGSAHRTVYMPDFKKLAILLPPLGEQQKIAEILAVADDAIQAVEVVIEQMKKVKRGVQSELLALCALTTIDRTPPPAGWRQVRLGEVFTERTEPGVEGLPLLTVTMRNGIKRRDALDRRVVSELTPYEHLRVRPGDIAYNMMRMWQGASGLVSEDGMISPAYVVATPTSAILPDFAAALFKNPSMIRLLHGYSQGVTGDRLRLYYEQFATIPVSLPPLEEQQRAVDALAPCDEVIYANEARLECLQKAKAVIMSDLLLGRRRVGLGNVGGQEPAHARGD